MANIFEIVEQKCKQNREKIAYVQLVGKKVIQISFEEFLNDVNNKIDKLKSLKLSKGSIIGINISRSYQVCSLLVACSALDFIFLPLDTDYPQKYIKYITKKVGVDLLITEDKNKHFKPRGHSVDICIVEHVKF